jgi:hypothetical protein
MMGFKSSPSRARTYDLAVNSRSLYQLSYRGMLIVTEANILYIPGFMSSGLGKKNAILEEI